MKKIMFLAITASVLGLTSCKKEGCTDSNALNYDAKAKKENGTCKYQEDTEPVEETGKVMISMDHQWENSSTAFELEKQYVNVSNGDTLTFTTFKYYISNFKLKKEDGSWWTHPESYFLVDLSDPATIQFDLEGVPVGNYTEVSYVLGVDSTRNVSGAQSGALSTTHGMFWSWNSGYIMLKAEGMSPQISGMGNAFTYHLGGFSGTNNIVSFKSNTFVSENLHVAKTNHSMLHFAVDPSKMFKTIGSVSNVSMIHMPGANAVTIASDMYTDGFAFKMVHNN